MQATLVTPDNRIVVLDFAGASVRSSVEDCSKEKKHMTMLLGLRTSCDHDA